MNEVVQAIITLLKNELGATYKKYYFGEIVVPNQAYMPFLEVVPMTSRITNRGTGGMANNEYNIRVNIKTSLKKYVKENTNVETLDHVQDLVEKMEGRTDGNINANSILGVLHNNLKLSGTAHIVDNWEITYDELDFGDSYIAFASISFTVKVLSI